MRLGRDTGSTTNWVMSAHLQPAPEVGMAATVLWWTDREAGTIIKVTPKSFTVQIDKATRIDHNGASEQQEYTYERDPNGRLFVFRMTKTGYWRTKDRQGVCIGQRDKYHDFSF